MAVTVGLHPSSKEMLAFPFSCALQMYHSLVLRRRVYNQAVLRLLWLGCRHVRSVRDEDSAVYRSCAFLGNFAALALGSHSGEVRIHDTLSGDLIDTLDAHDTPAYQLRVRPPP